MKTSIHHAARCCKHCGKQLSKVQVYRRRTCCSDRCRDKLNAATAGCLNPVSLREPWDGNEEREFHKAIEVGKREVRSEFDQFIGERTPMDESPEAERMLRERMGLVVVSSEENENEEES